MKGSIFILALLCNCNFLFGQVDTTSAGYKIGYSIGSWLPVILIVGMAILVMLRFRKYRPDK